MRLAENQDALKLADIAFFELSTLAMPKSRYSSDAFLEFIVNQTPVYDKLLMEDIRPMDMWMEDIRCTDMWIDLLQTGDSHAPGIFLGSWDAPARRPFMWNSVSKNYRQNVKVVRALSEHATWLNRPHLT